MKFQFKIQPYQTDAVNSVVNAFAGQPFKDKISYIRDVGKVRRIAQTTMFDIEEYDEQNRIGFENAKIELSEKDLLENINSIQTLNNINLSPSLIKELGHCSLDVEMETGTGKTYVYIKTIFELNKRYGWSKFIVVVPSIAIREGVKKSFEITQAHFMEYYGKKIRPFVYNSKNLPEIDSFSSSSGIQVMIINIQAFNTRGADARRIYEKLDEFQSRRPIDVIKANRPIVILDEPQKMGGAATQESLKEFNPLFCLNYSATHAKQHNLIYVLDALDAYNKKLVKKIEVKGFEVRNLRGTDKYLYLEEIIVSPKHPPIAKIEFEVIHKNGIKREIHRINTDDNLYILSGNMEQYKGYTVKEINPFNSTVAFLNGEVLSLNQIVGDVSESDMRRIQIRETILSHFQKEEQLFDMGIKTLSLFFIDEVAKYRQYDNDGNELLGDYGKIFEEEYINILNDYIRLDETPYIKYLKKIEISDTHKGYFSIDNKTGHAINSATKRNATESDDISAYDLILKNKERLLSFEEPTRFIFSHSALREGWDNPNVFQICTLKHSDSTTQKRQEVGRGLRLCVNQSGNRMDLQACGEEIHTINKLTVIASESYATFVGDLQKQIKEVLYDRPTKATFEYFKGKTIIVNGKQEKITDKQAKIIVHWLSKNDYVDYDDNITPAYREALDANSLADMPEEFKPMSESVQTLIQGIFDKSVLDNMIDNAAKTSVKENPLNDNFYKKEFQTLWNYINHKYAYKVEFDSEELISKAISNINEKLYVTPLKYTVTVGGQKDTLNEHEIERMEAFDIQKSKTQELKRASTSRIFYDLIGKIADGTTLTRKTVAVILSGIEKHIFAMFKNNPEEFITKVINLIDEQKATMIVDHISYNQTEGEYDSSIFTSDKTERDFTKAYESEKNVQDYIFPDGTSTDSIERRFAKDLDVAEEVSVFAKLPRGFQIPTPVGNYAPDWAIAFKEGSVKHIFFVAETKGTMETLQLRPIETAKIKCAKKLFNDISTSKVKYHDVNNYQALIDVIGTV